MIVYQRVVTVVMKVDIASSLTRLFEILGVLQEISANDLESELLWATYSTNELDTLMQNIEPSKAATNGSKTLKPFYQQPTMLHISTCTNRE